MAKKGFTPEQIINKLREAEIAYELMGFNKGMAASNIATSNEEMVKLHAEFSQLLSDFCLMVIIGRVFRKRLPIQGKSLKQYWPFQLVSLS